MSGVFAFLTVAGAGCLAAGIALDIGGLAVAGVVLIGVVILMGRFMGH